jgi:hypothetical protein
VTCFCLFRLLENMQRRGLESSQRTMIFGPPAKKGMRVRPTPPPENSAMRLALTCSTAGLDQAQRSWPDYLSGAHLGIFVWSFVIGYAPGETKRQFGLRRGIGR